MLALTLVLLSAAFTPAAAEPPAELPDLSASEKFTAYWYSGKAELTRYELKQALYGAMYEGDAVLIFVTEDVLPDKHVKPDSTNRARTGALPALKLNSIRQFKTGIYPYSMMTSVFTPVSLPSHPRTLKTSTTVQDWCGHVYLQLNLRGDRYAIVGHSYFELEADEAFELPVAMLEDEVWTRIRLAPQSLPTGTFDMIPGAQYSRLRHQQPILESVQATVKEHDDGSATYRLWYEQSDRVLAIRFQRAFPHEILGWEETYPSGIGPFAPRLTTRATRTHSIRSAYWRQNRPPDEKLRKELGLD